MIASIFFMRARNSHKVRLPRLPARMPVGQLKTAGS